MTLLSADPDALALFDLSASLNPLWQPAIEPPANPPPASADSHLTRRGWPYTTAQTTLAPRAKNPPTAGKWIDVNIARQTVTAYVGTKPIKTVLTSTGTRLHPTVTGTYRVYAKIPSQTMTGGSRAAGDYYRLPGVPNIMYFYQGYALHGTYWHRNFGHPMSHGCVNLTLADAAWFYAWTPMRTIVRTHH
jgi:lipoprotein-anchoring transpeptidase ErfK/SrfK